MEKCVSLSGIAVFGWLNVGVLSFPTNQRVGLGQGFDEHKSFGRLAPALLQNLRIELGWYCPRFAPCAGEAASKKETISLADLAEQVGYQSETAFSRAFERFNGNSPGAVRRSAEKAE